MQTKFTNIATEQSAVRQHGTGINAANLQEFLESAANAADKGQSQFFTPRTFGKLCAIPLPKTRLYICDLNAGAGDLLYAAVNATTRHLMGSDIDGCDVNRIEGDKLSVQKTVGDLTRLYPLLREIHWDCPLYVLNPPWDLHWYRERLKFLEESEVPAIREAFKAMDPRLGKKTIDSTVATLMIAMDLLSTRGEGLLIGNQDTLERLILDEKAPHRALAQHIWANLTIEGNPMTSDAMQTWDKEKVFRTGVIYFAATHLSGCGLKMGPAKNLDEFAGYARHALDNRFRYRKGGEVVSDYHLPEDTDGLWLAVRDEWQARKAHTRSDYHIWLAPDGTIRTNLSRFEKESVKVDKREAERLFSLTGQRPMQLVVQASQRKDLLRAVNGGIWRVHPNLPKLVEEAVRAYHACRAPLAKLSPVQSLGYLDEENSIRCTKDLMGDVPDQHRDGSYWGREKPVKRSQNLAFKAGQAYDIKTQTLHIERPKTKPDPMTGKDMEYLMIGQELAIYIRGEGGHEFCFMDARLKTEGVKIGEQFQPITIDFTLQDLVGHFAIPEVPDVAQCHPEKFQLNLQKLDELELMMNCV